MARNPTTRWACAPKSSSTAAATSSASAIDAPAGARLAMRKRRRDDQRPDRDGSAMAAVGQAAGQRRGHRPGDPGEREQRDAALAKPEGVGEEQRNGRPEQREGGEQAGLIESAPLQHRRTHGECRPATPSTRRSRRATPAAAAAGRSPTPPRSAPSARRREEYRSPGSFGGEEAGGRPRRHDAEHDSHRDSPTTRPRRAAGAKCAASGDSTWTATEPKPISSEQARKPAGPCTQPGAEQAERGERDRGERQAAVLDQVGERNDQQQAGAVAELGQRDDQSCAVRRQAQLGGDRRDQRLGVVDVGDDQSAGGGEQRRQARRKRRLVGRRSSRLLRGVSAAPRKGAAG